ncbi:efflux RND transporter periplasmic adaptor subunit [Coxiella-like endosymbiont]|uniref:efflux RND transporter periplasmic adaptor subunit n=1 Tax=Coxiella-like endosymbiont TaxID=1592897 RepID=UPI00272BEF72|nr:efflux RND transporter periplasmic adaptor subunit [Coxiella-like endosymbiont]
MLVTEEITEETRNINLQGTLPNENYCLYPRVFVEVTVYLPEEKQVITVPQTAVSYSLYGDTVFFVELGTDAKDNSVLISR